MLQVTGRGTGEGARFNDTISTSLMLVSIAHPPNCFLLVCDPVCLYVSVCALRGALSCWSVGLIPEITRVMCRRFEPVGEEL